MTYEELELAFRRHMYFSHDPDELLAVVSVILAQQLDTIPVWMFLIAPSGGGKSMILEAAAGCPEKVYVTDILTPKSLISAYREPGRKSGKINPDFSLMSKLNGKTLVIPDFMAILDTDARARNEVFGQLRQAFSGRLQRDTGLGKIAMSAKFNMICGGTMVVDRFREQDVAMGERFLTYRSRQIGGRELGMMALRATSDDFMTLELQASMGAFLVSNEITPLIPVLPEDTNEMLLRWAEASVRLRNSVSTNEYTGEISYPVDRSEEVTRMLKQLKTMFYAASSLSQDPHRAIRLVAKITMDCIPFPRFKAIAGIMHGAADAGDLSDRFLKVGPRTMGKILRELTALGAITVRTRRIRVTDRTRCFIEEVASFSDASEQLAR